MRGSGFRRPTTADSTKTSKCARSPSVGRRPSATQLFVRAPTRSPRSRIVRTAASIRGWGRLASRSEEHTSELQSQSNLVCRLLLEKKKKYGCCDHSKTFDSAPPATQQQPS